MAMDRREVQPLNELLSIELTEVGMAMDRRDVHWKKAKLPMSVTEVGMETVSSDDAR
jgi:hypothetical protein